MATSSLSSFSVGFRGSEPSSPIFFFFLFHKAIGNELDVLHRLATASATGQLHGDIQLFLEKYHFLGLIYKHQLNAKDEVIFAALDARVKNLVKTYFLQHKGERDLFDELLELLNSTMKNEVTFTRELASLTGALQQLVTQNMAKEEKQVFPLIMENFSLEEQASLLWKFLSSMPTYVLAKVLSWLPTSISTSEYQDLNECLRKIVPEEMLLQQALFNWITTTNYDDSKLSSLSASDVTGTHPIDDILLWQIAIKKELNGLFEIAKSIYLSGDFTNLSAFHWKLQFVAQVCIFHSIGKDKVIFPALNGATSCPNQHAEVESRFNEFWNLIQSTGAVSTSSDEFRSKFCFCIDQIVETINRHFNTVEVQVLPLAREHFDVKKQRELMYKSLCLMPLNMIERVLPWLIGRLNDEEAKNFLNNMQLAGSISVFLMVKSSKGHILFSNFNLMCSFTKLFDSAPASDVGLVKLFCSWASKAANQGLCSSLSSSGCCSVKYCMKLEDLAQSNCASSFGLSRLFDTSLNSGLARCVEQPIDVIFQVHKAIRRDLEYLSMESGRISDGDETFLQQFIGRFCLLWGLYKAHSDAEDNIVYPALESREALQNLTHSYKHDHEQEDRMFGDISCVLTELSQIQGRFKSANVTTELSGSSSGFSAAFDGDCTRKFYELSAKIQVMLKSLRIMVDQHMFREEHELWPLFGSQFSVEEQHKIVGFILGTTGAETLQLMLQWVTFALTQDEQSKMMDTLKQVTKNTMFSDWLEDCAKGTAESKGFEFQGQSKQMLRPYKNDSTKAYLDLAFAGMRKPNKLQNLMTCHWNATQKRLPTKGEDFTENLEGRSPSFRDPEKEIFGCKHYKRNCKLRATCCGKLFTCSFCHDSVSDHSMERKASLEMMCMRCLNIQPIGPTCQTPTCNGFFMAKYYCNICKLFDDERNVYHCPFCNLCRVGKGLGIDYFHCMSCNCCLSIKILTHECKENCLESNCPACNEFLFTSSTPVRGLPCGHYIHSSCFEANPYPCLSCSQSAGEKKSYKSKLIIYFIYLFFFLMTIDLNMFGSLMKHWI
ncbi:hypothetical protein UlMin_026137 [Ulmus minor]